MSNGLVYTLLSMNLSLIVPVYKPFRIPFLLISSILFIYLVIVIVVVVVVVIQYPLNSIFIPSQRYLESESSYRN